MNCVQCGNEILTGQAFCSRCGKQIIGPVAVAQPLRGRVQSHIQLLAILWFALSAFNALAGLFLLILGTSLFPHLHEMKGVPPDVPTGFLSALFSTLAIIVLAKAACGFVVGWGLVTRAPWARILALVLAFISMVTNIPLGTALGIYTLWVLLPQDAGAEYQRMAGRG
jgi:urea transporter